MDNDSLKDKTIRNMMWSFMDTIGSKGIQLGMQLFLARLLTPFDFGVLGMATIFIILSQSFVESGFINGLIRDTKSSQEDYSTVFFFNLISATLIYAVLFVSAGHISQFFEAPQLMQVLRVLGVVLIIDAFSLIQKTLLTKSLNFSIQMKINLASSLFSGVVALIFALTGFGVWSLVIKILILQSTQAIAYMFFTRWKPDLVFSLASFKKLFSFGWKLLVSRLLSEVYESLYTLIIGRGFSTTSLGFYTNAKKLSDTASYSIVSSVAKVSYPVLSNLQEDVSRLKGGFQRILKSSAFLIFPAMMGLAVIAPSLFSILLGDNWLPSVPYFQIISISSVFISMHTINLDILQVKGRSDLFLKVNILQKIVGFSIIGVVLFLGLGIYGLLWGLVADSFITYFINSSYSKKLIGYSIFEQLKDVKLIFTISLIMAGCAHSLSYLVSGNDLLLLISQILLGIFIYLLLSIIFKLEEIHLFYQIMKPIQKTIVLKMTVKN